MYNSGKIHIAEAGNTSLYLLPSKVNRHGLIAGATGTGKTTTLKVLAESFSDAGIPVFLADVKGDLSGLCREGNPLPFITERIRDFGLEEKGFAFKSFPTTFWDIYGQQGLPLRTTISEMGPILLSRILSLTLTQESILQIIFQIADQENLLLIDSKDLRAMILHVTENAAEYSQTYGNMSKASLNVILRAVTALEGEGAGQFFGEPALDIRDWIRQDCDGKGMINILSCQRLINSPKMYAVFMLWMLSELFEVMPEVGDQPKPRIVFFFDEAHLLFQDMPKALLQKIEQVVKLVRSKGVGVYFITQNPKDIPDSVLAQLGNRIQHALHAYTPAEQKGLKAAAESFRVNPAFKTLDALQELGIGEALISFLQEDGTPSVVERALILPPQSASTPLSDAEIDNEVKASALYFKYAESFDRDSAYEFLMRKQIADEEAQAAEKERIEAEKAAEKERIAAEKAAEKERIAAEKAAEKARAAAEKAAERERIAAEKAVQKQQEAAQKRQQAVVNSVVRSTGGTIGREIGKTIGGSVGGQFGKTLGGNLGSSLGRGLLGNLFKR